MGSQKGDTRKEEKAFGWSHGEDFFTLVFLSLVIAFVLDELYFMGSDP